MFWREVPERSIDRNVIVGGERKQLIQLVLVSRSVPGGDGSFANRFRRIGDNQVQIEFSHISKAFARRAGAERTVEAQPPRFRIGKDTVAMKTFEPAGKIEPLPGALVDDKSIGGQLSSGSLNQSHRVPVPLLKRCFEGVSQPLIRLLSDHEAIDDDEQLVIRRASRHYVFGNIDHSSASDGPDKPGFLQS